MKIADAEFGWGGSVNEGLRESMARQRNPPEIRQSHHQ